MTRRSVPPQARRIAGPQRRGRLTPGAPPRGGRERRGTTRAALRGAALALSVGLTLASGVALAWADTYLDDAVAGLDATRCWVSPEVTAPVDPSAVVAGDPAGRVTVAVFPDQASLEATAAQMAQDLAAATGRRTVLVAIGGDLSARSADLPAGEAARLANEAEASAQGLEGALAAAVTALADAVGAQGPAADAGPPGESSDAGSGLAALFVVIAVMVVGGCVLAVLLARRTSRRASTPRRGPMARRDVRVSRATPSDVADHLGDLKALRGRYLSLPPPTHAQGAAMAEAMTRIVADTSELFRRLARRGGGDQLAVAQVEYRDQLAKVVDVLGEDYYLDILARPDLWDDPAGRGEAVAGAVRAFSQQIVDNIKQVNAAQDLRFRVSLDALARAKRDQAAGLFDTPDTPDTPTERPTP